MLSNSIIESEELRDLFNTAVPEYAVPGLHKFLETMVPAEFNRIEIKLNAILKQANFCSITLDLWSNRQMRSYIGITCHLIDSNFKLHSFLLECGRFKGSHTAANISSHVQEVTAKFDLQSKLDFIITDNAANMVSAFDCPVFSEIVICDTDTLDLDLVDCDELGEYIFFTKHERCFAHSLQLVIKHAFKKGEVPDYIKKVQRIVSFIRKSGRAGELLEGEPRAQASNQTRWNSQLKMIRSVCNIDRTKLDTLPGLDPSDRLSISDRVCLREFQEIMTPFEEATDRVQGIANCDRICKKKDSFNLKHLSPYLGENIVTSSFVLPSINGIRRWLNENKSKWPNHGFLVQFLLEEMKRLSKYETNSYFQFATFLDPR